MSPPDLPTLAYSTHRPGEPIISARPDGRAGIEIDIPPQGQRWRAHWPPRTAGAWIAVVCAAAVALAPFVVIVAHGLATGDGRQMAVLLLVASFIGCFLMVAVGVALQEGAVQRTTIFAGPDGLTVTTVGGMAWPRPRHWPRDAIKDLKLNPLNADGSDRVVIVLAGPKGGLVVRQIREALALNP